ncbi:MAG: hypothetical protein Q9218_005818 [Villophora microphyllina]
MKASSYFEQALFKDNTTAIDDYFDLRRDQLFEPSKERSYVEFYIQLEFHKGDKDTQAAFEVVSRTQAWDSDLESDSGSDPSSPTEQSKYLGDPPRYTGAPILRRKISDIQSLNEVAASDKVLVASIDERDPLQLVNIDERQVLKDSEDSLIDNLLILDSTLDTITSLLSVYNRFCQDCGTQLENGYVDEVDLIEMALQEQHRVVSSYRKQIETLRMKVQGSIQLLSSLLDLGNGSSLKALAEATRQENATMRKLTEKKHEELDSTAPSLYPNPAQQEFAYPSPSLPRTDQDYTGLSISGPTIVVHHSESGQSVESLKKTPHSDGAVDIPPSQPKDEWSPMSQDSPISDIGRSFGSTSRPSSPAGGLVIPEVVQYTIHITFEREAVPITVDGSVRLDDASDYQLLEKSAEDCVKAHCESSLAGKTLYFRNGDCTIVGDDTDRHVHGLSSAEDWRDVCTVLKNFFDSNRHQHQRLHITRDYFALLIRRVSDESFARSKRDEIWGLMKKGFDNRLYIPRTDLMRVTSADMIRQIILEDPLPGLEQAEQESFIQCVLRRGRKLLAMCVYAELQMKCLKVILDAGHTDSTLKSKPFEDEDCCHTKCGPRFMNLLQCQGGFNAAEFSTLGEHKQFHRCTVLPIRYHPREKRRDGVYDEGLETHSEVEESKLNEEDKLPMQRAFCGSGAFSKVYRVRLDPAHHNLSTDKIADFALKIFIDRPSRTGATFDKELRILDELRKHSNDHIATHLATWTQDGKYYMLFPYAQCNLGQYMRRVTFGNPTKKNTLWFLRQLLGLASALRQIHNLSGPEGTAGSSTNLLAPAVKDLRKSGWHHDLKPENILYFRIQNYMLGEFHIADFGSGKVHTYRSGSVNTKSPNGTQTYEPPEFAKEGATSRPYDMWSMGCVFLELLVWAIFDYEAVKTFATNRGGRRFPDSQTEFTDDDAFWQMDEEGNISLRQAVVYWLKELRSTLQPHRLKYFEKVLDLIERMLDTDRRTRILALDLWDTLERIFKQANVDMKRVEDDALLADVDIQSKDAPTYLPRLSTVAPDRRTPEPLASPTVTITADAHPPSKQRAQYIDGGLLAASPVATTSSPRVHRRNSSASNFTLSSRSRGQSDSSTRVQNGSSPGGHTPEPYPEDG